MTQARCSTSSFNAVEAPSLRSTSFANSSRDKRECPRLASYAAAKSVVMPSVTHLRGWRQNNRVENSHQPVRQRERDLQRFKSLRHAARFCSVFSTVCNQFRPGRHALSAPNYRMVMRERWREWDSVAETTAFAVAA